MATKKRFFTRNKEKIYRSPQDRTSVGNKSVNTREKQAQKSQIKVKEDKQKKEIIFRKPQLPNISQTITDVHAKVKPYLIWQKIALLLFFLLVSAVSLWQGMLLVQKSLDLQQVVSQRMKLSEDLALWEGIAQKYPTYRDAYFQASVLAYRLGDRQKEQLLLDKTLQLDPNYLPAQNLEKILQ